MKYPLPVFLLILSIFFIRLPPFYILPIHSAFLMSHTIARLCILAGLFLSTLNFPQKHHLPKTTAMLVLLWFTALSISVVGAKNVVSFFDAYKDIVFGILLFFLTFFVVKKSNITFIILALFFTTTLHLLFQFFLYFFPQFSYILLGNIIYESYWHFFTFQYNRGRFFGDTLDESLIPVLFYIFTFRKGPFKIFSSILFSLTTFITIASNWRSKLVVYAFALISSLFLFFQSSKKIIVYIIATIFLFFFLSNFFSLQSVGYNVIDRVIYGGTYEEAPIIARFHYWQEAIDIASSNPLLGIGLGNYYDNLSASSQRSNQSSQFDRYNGFTVIEDPHNIFVSMFVSTGLFGLTTFSLLFGYFLYKDLTCLIRNHTTLRGTLIISFWSVFLLSMFNPWLYFGYIGFLFFLRGTIEKLYLENL